MRLLGMKTPKIFLISSALRVNEIIGNKITKNNKKKHRQLTKIMRTIILMISLYMMYS